jgi:hypothetical protein
MNRIVFASIVAVFSMPLLPEITTETNQIVIDPVRLDNRSDEFAAESCSYNVRVQKEIENQLRSEKEYGIKVNLPSKDE